MVFVRAGVLLWSSVFLVFVCAGVDVGVGVGVGVPLTLKIGFDELLFSINDDSLRVLRCPSTQTRPSTWTRSSLFWTKTTAWTRRTRYTAWKSRTVIAFKPLSPLLSIVRYCSKACSLGWAWGGLVGRSLGSLRSVLYDYRVHLELDQSTRSMKLPLEKYTGEPDAVVGSWVLLE